MTAQRLLVCSPSYFDVNYSINAWMDPNTPEGRVDIVKAKEQWLNFVDVLQKFAQVELLPPVKGLPDYVFTANAGLVYKEIFVPSIFKYPERKGETPYYAAWACSYGLYVASLDLDSDEYFEGAGDCLLDRHTNILWMGFGYRTSRTVREKLQAFLNKMFSAHPDADTQPELRVFELQLVDPRFYHLDTAFCPLDGGALLYNPNAFSAASVDLIHTHVPEALRIPVSQEDADLFACNAVSLGRYVIVNDMTIKLERALNELGYIVYRTPLSEYLKSGGGAKCLTLKLIEPSK